MNAKKYIAVFAGISVAGLALHLIADFWLPMLIGGCLTLLVARVVR
ncbi:MAG: hypothetical protein JWO82_2588 [Akkermansiaceae bacterium]|nr:hypothetical protein [Akkermansiaceae bacterium]